jgi:lipopolysaccharide transport system ATP-binding protein
LLLDDVPQKVVSHYLLMGMEMIGERVWPDLDQAPGDDVARLRAVRVLDSQRNICTSFDVRDPVSINMEYSLLQDQDMLEVSLYFYNQRGELLFVAIEDVRPRAAGNYRSTCLIPSDFLNDCQIYVLAGLTDEKKIHTIQRDIVNFSVTDAMDAGGARGTYRAEWPPSAVRPKLEWKVDWIPQTEAAT